jgi:hypothetical protein
VSAKNRRRSSPSAKISFRYELNGNRSLCAWMKSDSSTKRRQKTPRYVLSCLFQTLPSLNQVAKTTSQERDSLNNTIHDIELAIERGKQQHPRDPAEGAVEMTGVELLLKRVAGEVSSKSDAGGLLKQIRDFNAFLERAAVALETRKS